MVLYFQFLKAVSWMFFIASIFSAPAYIFYYSGNTSNGQTNIKSELTAFTLGNIGQCKFIYLLLNHSSIRMQQRTDGADKQQDTARKHYALLFLWATRFHYSIWLESLDAERLLRE